MKIINPTFGSDFELPALYKQTNLPASVIDRLKGSKTHPHPIGNDCFYQVDGVNFEANIPPVTTREEWESYIDYCISKGNEALSISGLELVIASSMIYPDEELQHRDARRFGCDPSYDAYSGFGSYRNVEDAGNMRSAGFHCHIGFYIQEGERFSYKSILRLMQIMDIYLGLPSLLLDNDTDRRRIYGNAGDFRIKRRGQSGKLVIAEYRTLGSNMLNHKGFVFDQMEKAVEAFNEGMKGDEFVREAINRQEINLAKYLINKKYNKCYNQQNILQFTEA